MVVPDQAAVRHQLQGCSEPAMHCLIPHDDGCMCVVFVCVCLGGGVSGG